jgi:predicted deacylase
MDGLIVLAVPVEAHQDAAIFVAVDLLADDKRRLRATGMGVVFGQKNAASVESGY